MKFFKTRAIFIMIAVLAIFINSKVNNASTHKNTSTYWIRPLIKTAQSYHSFANLPYCPGDIINNLSCPLCSSIIDASFKVFRFYKKTVNGIEYTFVILFSQNRNEVIISFSGPKKADPSFYTDIYKGSFKAIKDLENKVKIEEAYLNVYNGEFSNELVNAIKDYQIMFKANSHDHQYVFVGHRFGGALATIAAYDMVKSGVIIKNEELNSPVVYSYGALRVGNSRFVQEVNSLFKIIRINKDSDAVSRLAACSWAPSVNQYECDGDDIDSIIKKNNRPELYAYIQNYYGDGKKLNLQNAVEAAYGGDRGTIFLEKKSKAKLRKNKRNLTKAGWTYSTSNPGYIVDSVSTPFDRHGHNSEYAGISYSQPLGAEILFSNNFKRHTICSYFNGIPVCEQNQLRGKFNPNDGDSYFDAVLNNC